MSAYPGPDRARLAAEAPGVGNSLWGLDIMLAITILAMLNALALGTHRSAVFKAKATEGLLAASNNRNAVVEHYALTGEWLDSDVGRESSAASGAPGGAADEVDQVMRGQQGRPGLPSAREGGDRTSSDYLRTTTGVVDGVIIVLGNYRGHDNVSMLTLRPAVIEAPEQPTVRLLCGRNPTPKGWSSPSVSEPTSLPDELLFSICRDARTR